MLTHRNDGAAGEQQTKHTLLTRERNGERGRGEKEEES